jgi:hypothetical protein
MFICTQQVGVSVGAPAFTCLAVICVVYVQLNFTQAGLAMIGKITLFIWMLRGFPRVFFSNS